MEEEALINSGQASIIIYLCRLFISSIAGKLSILIN